MSTSRTLFDVEGPIAFLSFNRPEARNAMTWEMYEALDRHVRAAEADDSVRAILFHGTPEVFTAGNDLEDFVTRPPQGEDTPVFRFLRAHASHVGNDRQRMDNQVRLLQAPILVDKPVGGDTESSDGEPRGTAGTADITDF